MKGRLDFLGSLTSPSPGSQLGGPCLPAYLLELEQEPQPLTPSLPQMSSPGLPWWLLSLTCVPLTLTLLFGGGDH